MQIKTITCHDVYNHGASLQAYALQRYLTGQGHEVEIIDYKPWYLSNHYKLSSISNPKYDKFIIKYIYLLAKLPGRVILLKRKRAFDRFKKKYLKLTPKRYASFEELKANCPEADIYIAGSDQIWNTIFENGKDPAFYLDFVPAGKKRVAYAASFATEKIANGYEDFVKKLIGNIHCISVREQTGVELLHYLGIKYTVQVCDPVFLLSQKQWNDLGSISYPDKYLLVYDTEKSNTLKEISMVLAKKMNLKIYSAGSFKLSYANRNFHQSGPVEFVSLIKNAEYVISNSFHGSAFALIFQKNFCVVNRSEAINSRMHNLLEGFGLSNRLVNEKSNLEEFSEMIDYSSVNQQLKLSIDLSKQYLQTAIHPLT
jgi:hypothetical protein